MSPDGCLTSRPGPGHGTVEAPCRPYSRHVQARVLVVDDDATVAEVVAGYLARAGYEVEQAADGPEALRRVRERQPDLVVLDLMLPGLDGVEVCRRIRGGEAARPDVPVVMLTAMGEEDDRISGLEVGADDYVTKPFSPRELVLRVESVLRRAGSGAAPRPDGAPGALRAGDLLVDLDAHRVTRAGRTLALTAREYDLLTFLVQNPGVAFSREDLMHRVWGWSYGDLSTVTVHIRRLREKVEADAADPRLVVTVWGVGYRFDAPAEGTERVAQHATRPVAAGFAVEEPTAGPRTEAPAGPTGGDS